LRRRGRGEINNAKIKDTLRNVYLKLRLELTRSHNNNNIYPWPHEERYDLGDADYFKPNISLKHNLENIKERGAATDLSFNKTVLCNRKISTPRI
jgi:hypothetical protein